jgi:hypothetical protein
MQHLQTETAILPYCIMKNSARRGSEAGLGAGSMDECVLS